MRALEERAEEIGRVAADRKLDEIGERIKMLLPRAKIERIASSISIRQLQLMKRLLDDPDLRFLWRGL